MAREGVAVTEAEWLACTDPTPMLEFLRGKATRRKLRLFAVACCRHLWRFFTDDRSRKAIEVNEEYLAGLATEAEVARAEAAVREAMRKKWDEVREARRLADDHGRDAPFFIAHAKLLEAEFTSQWLAEQLGTVDETLTAGLAAWSVAWAKVGTGDAERKFQSDVLRDVVPNPFHPPSIDSVWLTPKVIELSRAIYGNREFGRLSTLADALEEAGCTSPLLLTHCRGPGPHVLGCWAIDQMLGRT